MGWLMSSLTKAQQQVERAERMSSVDAKRLAEFRAEERSVAKTRPAASDFEGLLVHDERLTAIRRKIAIAEGVAAQSSQLLADARAELEMAIGDAEHAAEERLAEKDRRAYLDFHEMLTKVAAKRDEAASGDARNAAYNKRRGNRPYIPSGQERARATPSRTIPAVVEEQTVWRDESGATPMFLMKDEKGDLVPAGAHSYRPRREQVVVSPEQFIPQRMPEPYETALVLVDLQGRPL